MKLLLESFKKYLNEDVNTDHLALYIYNAPERANFFYIYDPSLMIDYESTKDSKTIFLNGTIKSMVATDTLEDYRSKCWGSKQIIRAASDDSVKGKGIGNLIYQIAMTYEDTPMTGDRSGTSKSAQRVYDKLPAKSKDFDDMKNPKTPPKEDDCYVSDDTINKAYWLDDSARSKAKEHMRVMLQNHVNFIENVQEKLGVSPHNFESRIRLAGDMMFGHQYRKQFAE